MGKCEPEETYSNAAPICPYCGHLQSNDDGEWYNEDLSDAECGSCLKPFKISVYNSWSWTCEPIEDDQP